MRLFAIVAVACGHSLALRPPPTLDKDLLNAIPFEADWDTKTLQMELPCPTCRVGPNTPLMQLPIDYEPRPGETFPESVLRLNISVIQTEHDDILMLDGCEYWPSPGKCTSLWVDQFVKSPCGTWEYKATPETAFSITRDHVNDDVLGRGIQLNLLQMKIGRVATRLIAPEPEIEVKMLIFPNGQLLIATDPATAPTKFPPPGPDCPHHGHRPGHNDLCAWMMKFIRDVIHELSPVILGLVVAAAAFYVWRSLFLRRHRSIYSGVSQEVARKDGHGDKLYIP